MVIFHSYVSLPEGTYLNSTWPIFPWLCDAMWLFFWQQGDFIHDDYDVLTSQLIASKMDYSNCPKLLHQLSAVGSSQDFLLIFLTVGHHFLVFFSFINGRSESSFLHLSSSYLYFFDCHCIGCIFWISTNLSRSWPTDVRRSFPSTMGSSNATSSASWSGMFPQFYMRCHSRNAGLLLEKLSGWPFTCYFLMSPCLFLQTYWFLVEDVDGMDGNFTGNPTLLTITCLQMSTVVISSYLYKKIVRLQNRYDDPTYSRWLNQQELLEYAKNTQGLVQLRASYVAWNRRRAAKAGEYIYI